MLWGVDPIPPPPPPPPPPALRGRTTPPPFPPPPPPPHKKNKVTGLCFGLADVLALVPQAVGGGSAYIVAVLVINPADITAEQSNPVSGVEPPQT